MFTARITFRLNGPNHDGILEKASGLLASWYKNGQIVGDERLLTGKPECIEAYVRIPEEGALDAANHNGYVRDKLTALLPTTPIVEVLGPELEAAPVCTCSQRSAFVLFTHYLSNTTPVRCLDCFGVVPLYRLPFVKDREYLDFLQWEADYQACDTLQMHCTTGERFAERQLSYLNSSLSRNGRALCQALERESKTPVYYFLLKMRGRSRQAELNRLCPECGGRWRLDRQLQLFDFQCEHCRLVSSIATGAY